MFRHITGYQRRTQLWRPAEAKQLIAEVRCFSVMGLRTFWNNYKVLIVMGTSLGLIHLGWYNLKSNPLLQKREEYIPEPGIVAYVSTPAAAPPPAKSK